MSKHMFAFWPLEPIDDHLAEYGAYWRTFEQTRRAYYWRAKVKKYKAHRRHGIEITVVLNLKNSETWKGYFQVGKLLGRVWDTFLPTLHNPFCLTNTFCNLDKYILQLGQIHSAGGRNLFSRFSNLFVKISKYSKFSFQSETLSRQLCTIYFAQG